ncbi:hypothetical protein CEUSTIGMA_g10844.t1 [Chlamydomonas eustigma]|uniref:3-oxoacyl-[acyl-carrier-protein] reductase n=1 Tax=Chlamydomonas eustigma TaxID=1157962 RepID=A0A250XKG1_9CHLO|nr:hypothetical protein CEUSTIGMA_g10844.t1 [Chlamydomonas eustigma]|eukprot:GAX83419.1 hypothetical protein CEUSTIGMA_g10844.t1 [Chlamydomonas eustigma]
MPVTNIAQNRLDVISRQLCSTLAGRQLEGQVAIVTGAGKGIGEATAELLSSQGASIVVCDIDASAAQAVSDRIQSQGGRAVAVAADITNQDAAAQIIDAALSLGSIDIIVNNAGFTWDGVIHKMTPQQWQAMLDVHVTAPFRLVQAAAPYLREVAKKEIEQEGKARPRSIINISSTSGTHGNAGQANYSTAKAGVVGLTKSIAKEWGPLNVRCNALAFGLIDTRLTRPKEDGETIEVAGKAVPLGIPGANKYWSAVKSSIPLQRSGAVREAAGAIMMLVSPWASYITGQVIEVNGGAFM